MNKAQLIEKAKTFGIDTEGLTVAQLQAAIKAAVDAGRQELEQGVADTQAYVDGLATDVDTQIMTAALDAVVTAKSDLKAFLQQHFPNDPSLIEKEEEEEEEEDSDTGSGGDPGDEQEKKPAVTDPAPKSSEEAATPRTVFTLDDVDYTFSKNAPERFNFLGKNKTKEEWMADDVAMELLIQGRFQFIKQIKK